MSIETRQVGPRAILVLSGQLDFRAHRALKAACEPHLASPQIDELQLDLSAIQRLDSSALGLLLILRERSLARNKRVTLIRAGGPVAAMLQQARFGQFFTLL